MPSPGLSAGRPAHSKRAPTMARFQFEMKINALWSSAGSHEIRSFEGLPPDQPCACGRAPAWNSATRRCATPGAGEARVPSGAVGAMAGGRRAASASASWSSSRQSARLWSASNGRQEGAGGHRRGHCGPMARMRLGQLAGHAPPGASGPARAPHTRASNSHSRLQPADQAAVQRAVRLLGGHLFHRHRIDHAVEQAIGSFFRSRKRLPPPRLSEWRNGVLRAPPICSQARARTQNEQASGTAVSKNARLCGLGVQRQHEARTLHVRFRPAARCWGSTAVLVVFYQVWSAAARQHITALGRGAIGLSGRRGRCPGARVAAPGTGDVSTGALPCAGAGLRRGSCSSPAGLGKEGALPAMVQCASVACFMPQYLPMARFLAGGLQFFHADRFTLARLQALGGGLCVRQPWRGGAGCRPGFPCRCGFAPVRRRRPAARQAEARAVRGFSWCGVLSE